MDYLALLIGGTMGGMLRYSLSFIPMPGSFPLRTLIINLLGSFVLGLLYGMVNHRGMKSWLRIGLGTGILGSFTTFSSFCLQTVNLSSTDLRVATFYALGSVLVGPLLAFFGNQLITVFACDTQTIKEEASA